MNSVIRKWGNSPALRLSAETMRAAAFQLDQKVTVRALKGRIVIEPASLEAASLETLLSRMTPDNIHDEMNFGDPVGSEAL